MERKSMIIPLSADEIIAELREKNKAKKLRKNTEIIIRILSAEALFNDELVARLKKTDYNFRGADDEKIKRRLKALKCFHCGILSRQDGWYFIRGTLADPEIQERVSSGNQPLNQPGKKTGEIRALRSIIYEILQKEPLAVNRLAMRVKNHPDYDGRRGQGKKLLLAVNDTLNEGKERFFVRGSERKKFSLWRVIAGSNPPPKKFHHPFWFRRDELYQIMRSKSVIKGWSLLDLYEEVIKPGSIYQVKPGSAQNSVMTALYQLFHRDRGEYFERISVKRWRAKWLGLVKTPSSPEDFKDLVSKILDDAALPLSLDNLLKIVRQDGYLFGYLANELPLSFLKNNIVRAIVGTSYKNEGRVF